MAEPRRSGKLAVILHADVAGSTELIQQDERLAHERIQESFHRFGTIITQYHGRVRELRGDALLAEFERASDAVTAALAFQADQARYNSQIRDPIQPTIRVGIAMGEVIIADNTVTGAGAVLAQRVEQLAKPGGVVIQGAAYETIPGRFPFEYADRGEHEVKGFDKPVRAYSASLKSDTAIPEPEQTDHRFRNTVVAVASVAVVVVGIAFMWLRPWEVREEPASVERMAFPLPDKPSIAVLPFNNMSDNPQQEYFVDGMTEDLITDLSQLSGLFVIARNSVFTYKGKPIKVNEVAEELGVRYILEGSVRRAGNQVRINAQLIDATTGGHLWAKRYDGSLENVFALQDQVTEKIVNALAIELTPEEVKSTQKAKTVSSEAYDEYLKGQEQYRQGTPKSYLAAAEHFKRAVELDPGYGLAYAALAAAYWNSARNGWSLELGLTYTEAASQSREYLNEARKEPSPLAHQVASERASHLRHKPDEALAEAKSAIAMDPNDPSGHLAMANALIKAKRPNESVESIQHAMRLDPHYPASYLRRLGRAQLADGQFEAAAATLESAIERNPQDERAMVFLAATYGYLDQKEKAVDTVQKANTVRAGLGRGALTWENVDVELYLGRFLFTGIAGMKGDRDVLREGLRKAGVDRGYGWVPLVTTVGTGGSEAAEHDTAYEVDGATSIGVETAKQLHERGVPFIEVSTLMWLKERVPGAHLMDWIFGEFNERRLSQVVDKSEDVVISGRPYVRSTANACAAAVTWGYKKVYCFPEGSLGWQHAGYPIEKGH